MVAVELVFVPADKTIIHKHISLTDGATVADAIVASGILKDYPEAKSLSVGIFSRPVTPETQLKSGDRIELYRPLLIDPKENRRKRSV